MYFSIENCKRILYTKDVYFWLCFRMEDKIDEESSVLKYIKKCTKSLGKCSVEQTATLMAWSEKNELQVDKYWKRVQKQLDDDTDGED